ncbi:alpha/beta fold hydrolase [Nonomuraea candida]|uniref:alpha/beta fold hydrolase n=1 Tax=Nonomuraea candida TaxID=359159 RepID=UPI0005BAD974|nr:alpha/beta hydrolase [Nonomuraea candida]
MTIVFVHGVPVTSAVWTPLISQLPKPQQQDVVRLSPPGFGAALPAGFGARHEIAKTWQTPGDGERHIEETFSGDAAERTARMISWGIPEPAAGQVALGQGPEMGRAILSLYRSVPENMLAERGRNLAAAAARPGLVPVATDDLTAGSVALRHRAAQRAGARTVDLDGLGHWWMLQDPARTARMLSDFWNSL